MGPERGNGDMHPLAERQRAEQTVEMGLAVGAVQANGLGLAGRDGRFPEPDKMPLVHQLGCGGCLGPLAVLDLRLWSPVRNVDLELDEEFHDGLLPEVFRNWAAVDQPKVNA